MGKVTWITKAGSLGTIQEGKFYQINLSAQDEDTGDASTLYYKVIAGRMPEGIQCTLSGTVEGAPKVISTVKGVPAEVSKDELSRFTVRAYTEDANEQPLRVADRTFTLTVTGQDIPQWETTAGSLGTFFDATPVDITLEYSDPDPDQTITTELQSGELPPGLSLSSDGKITGVIEPKIVPGTVVQAGYDMSGYDSYNLEFVDYRSTSQNYEFSVIVTDGIDENVRTFSMYVYSRDDLTADTDFVTVDTTNITADAGSVRAPLLLDPPTDLGTVRHDNWYAYKFNGKDFDNDPIEYEMIASPQEGFDVTGLGFDAEDYIFDQGDLTLPPGLSLDPFTGWLSGYLPDIGLSEIEYKFAVRVKKADKLDSQDNSEFISPYYYVKITLVGTVDTDITWTQPETLGTLINGETSKLYVEAVASSGTSLQYELKQGSNSKLPQGLQLTPDGLIAGRVSFNMFSLDAGTTTFNEELGTRREITPCTFDRTYTFTVRAFNNNASISTFNDHKILLSYKYKQPYETLYIKAMPTTEDRESLENLLQNRDIFAPEDVYRINDPEFGVAEGVRYDHAYGLKTAVIDDYVEAVLLNHYKKELILGTIKTAKAKDVDGNVVYEVVYSEIQQPLVNNDGISIGLSHKFKTEWIEDDSVETDTVYPNSLVNMQTRIINKVGQFAEILPQWMTSEQDDGRILGFTPAWVLCYAKPGRADKIAFQIKEKYTDKLNAIDFRADRYEVDRTMTQFWSHTDSKFNSGTLTTFDRYEFRADLTYTRNVDYVTSLAFADINNATLTELSERGGIDGVSSSTGLDGKTIIFKKQEGFAQGDDNAWTDFADDSTSSRLIPGEAEDRDDSSPIRNERMGIWRIRVIDGSLITLDLVTTTDTNDYVKIVSGSTGKNNFLYHSEAVQPGNTVRAWEYLYQATTDESLFDGGSTRFISNVDSQNKDDTNDKYVVFPQHTIKGTEDYITNG